LTLDVHLDVGRFAVRFPLRRNPHVKQFQSSIEIIVVFAVWHPSGWTLIRGANQKSNSRNFNGLGEDSSHSARRNVGHRMGAYF
jgi:hypothetical protein